MKIRNIFAVLAGMAAMFFGFAAKQGAVTGFQEKLGESINIENALFAEDTKTPPAKSAIG